MKPQVSVKKRYKRSVKRFPPLREKLIGEEVKLRKVKIIVNIFLKMVLILTTSLLEKVLVVSVAREA